MKQSFNENWVCYRTGEKEKAFAVTLPHDAMQLDERSETSAGGVNIGWYEAQDYTYEKTFILPEKAKDEKVILEFEGVYRKATVYLNGEKVAYHSYGYRILCRCHQVCKIRGRECDPRGSDQPRSAKQPLVFRYRNLPSGVAVYSAEKPSEI